MTSVFISILNWNDAASTLQCVAAVRQSTVDAAINITLVVLDNGSRAADWTALQDGLLGCEVSLIRQEENSGFAAGHNVVIRQAVKCKADFVWLLNNDALVKPNTLAELLCEIREDSSCGVVSPLIYAHYDEEKMDFVGAIQDWSILDSRRAGDTATSKDMQLRQPTKFFVYGTAPLFRLAALSSAGLLDETFFAYYEDEEICARFAVDGWSSKMSFSSRIQHFQRKSLIDERPPYYFYLMTRNSLFFYLRHTPPAFRHLIRARLFSRAMLKSAQLRERGFTEKSNACLLGIWDGLKGRGGPPRLDTTPPLWLILASKVFPYHLHQWLDAS